MHETKPGSGYFPARLMIQKVKAYAPWCEEALSRNVMLDDFSLLFFELSSGYLLFRKKSSSLELSYIFENFKSRTEKKAPSFRWLEAGLQLITQRTQD